MALRVKRPLNWRESRQTEAGKGAEITSPDDIDHGDLQ